MNEDTGIIGDAWTFAENLSDAGEGLESLQEVQTAENDIDETWQVSEADTADNFAQDAELSEAVTAGNASDTWQLSEADIADNFAQYDTEVSEAVPVGNFTQNEASDAWQLSESDTGDSFAQDEMELSEAVTVDNIGHGEVSAQFAANPGDGEISEAFRSSQSVIADVADSGSEVDGISSESYEANSHEKYRQAAMDFNEKMEAIEGYNMFSEEELEQMRGGQVSAINNLENRLDKALGERMKSGIRMIPFKAEITPVSWVRIDLKDLLIPELEEEYAGDPTINGAYQRFRHLLLGKVEQDGASRFLVGAPDIYSAQSSEQALQGGFTFKCCEDVQPEIGVHGYWIKDLH